MKINFKKLIFYIGITFLIGNIFTIFVINNNFYNDLIKPINVPSIVFPIVWSILFILMGISMYIVSISDNKDKNAYIIYFIQLFVNSFWNLFFFKFKLFLFSFIWILLLIIHVLIMIVKFKSINKIAGNINIPYLLWLIFAAYLNLNIWMLN